MEVTKPKRHLKAVIALLFVAPLVAEFLLGDLPISFLPAVIVLAPMYGGAAVLIRETVRRSRRGWPSMLLLGAAYALVEEGFVTQSLFNHDYLKTHMHLLGPAYIPALGIGGWWTLLMLNVHMYWSIGVSIALVEGMVPEAAESPWMSGVGDGVVAVLFLLGLAANAAFQMKRDHFKASHEQFVSVGAICCVLIFAAFRLPSFGERAKSGSAPSVWSTGAGALVIGLGVMQTPPTLGWGAFAIMLTLDVVFLTLVALFARRRAWNLLHTLSLGAGGSIAYGLHAFFQRPVIPGPLLTARIGNGVFLMTAISLIVVGAKRTSRYCRLGLPCIHG